MPASGGHFSLGQAPTARRGAGIIWRRVGWVLTQGKGMDQNEKKRAAALAALGFIRPGTRLGVGTGSTVNFLIEALPRVAADIEVLVASSVATERRLRAAGFDRGTILGDWFTYSVAGNLRPHFPDSTLINLRDWNHKLGGAPAGLPWISPPARGGGQCLLVWTAGGNDREEIMRRSARLLFGAKSLESHAVGYVSAVMPPSGTRQVRLAYILVPLGAGTCR